MSKVIVKSLKLIFIISIILIAAKAIAVDISHDGRYVKVRSGESAVKLISLLNNEEMPRWVRISLQNSGPLAEVSTKNIVFGDNTALGWTYVKQGWLKILPQRLMKLRMEFMPPYKTKTGEYGVWMLIEQMNTSPKIIGEHQRGKSLKARTVQTYFIPVIIKVKK